MKMYSYKVPSYFCIDSYSIPVFEVENGKKKGKTLFRITVKKSEDRNLIRFYMEKFLKLVNEENLILSMFKGRIRFEVFCKEVDEKWWIKTPH